VGIGRVSGYRLEDAFRDAVALDAGARMTLLDRLVREDASLAHDLRELLDADARADARGLFERPAAADLAYVGVVFDDAAPGDGACDGGVAADSAAAAPDAGRGAAGPTEQERPPSLGEGGSGGMGKVGGYRVVSSIGRGGMGHVFLAERPDVGKRVAVKLLQSELASQEDVRRFLRERRVLAGLEHPNIVPLLDAGVTAEGMPYFAMEFVDGVSITEYCRRHALTLAARVRLFQTVCTAVEHAHQHLIVHRDLKPSNILVDRDGCVKLLDFGIAKLLDSDDEHEQLTHTGVSPMTPESAAPEQVRRQTVTPATDVYALGLLLFELLAGERAYSLRGLSPSRIEQTVCERVPARPSSLAASQERRRIAADLDAICLKALEKDPRQRYPTAGHLAADVARYLAGRPVKARTPTPLYRVGKFVRRHRLRLSIAACAMALALGALAGVLWQARRAEIARAESEAVSRFLMGLFELTDPAHGRPGGPTVRELIERGERQADRLAEQPLVQARMFDVIGRVYHRLGDLERAQVLLRQALAIRRGRLGEDHADVATSLANLALLLNDAEHHDEADALYQDALARRQRLLGHGAIETAQSVERYAIFVLRVRDDDKRAEAMLREALQREELRLDGARRNVSQDDASQEDASQKDASGPESSRVEWLRPQHSRSDGSRDEQRALARAVLQRGLAAVHSGRREYQAAADLLQQTVAAQRTFLGPSHPDTIQTLSLLGRSLTGAGDLASAERRVQEVLALQRQINGERHPSVMLTLANLGSLARRRGDLTRAEPIYREAVRLGEEILGADHPTVARISVGLAAVLAQSGRTPEAETLYRRILTTFDNKSDVGAHEVQDVHRRLAALYQDAGQPNVARRHTQLAQATLQ
jgi:eukaryotic-like serine/threonine-protein kinase